MKKSNFLLIALVIIAAITVTVVSCRRAPIEKELLKSAENGNQNVSQAPNSGCTTIKDGTLLNSANEVIKTGYDKWGYNYQARMFNGKYCDAYRDASWCQAWKNDKLIMKWNDAWLSNTDCDNDGLLDRHYGYSSYIGSGAWLTNHMSGTYTVNGKKCYWTYFTKIIAAPADATLSGGVWYSADNVEIGPAIWGEFAVIEEVYNDPCVGLKGVSYKSFDHSGFGGW
jgi:hypothetical protein